MNTAAKLYFKGVPPNALKVYNASQGKRIDRIVLCKEMGWTLSYAESLTDLQVAEVKAILNEYNQATGGLK